VEISHPSSFRAYTGILTVAVATYSSVKHEQTRVGSAAMIEVEMKFRVGDFAAIAETLAEWHVEPGPLLDEADLYFNAPDRDFAQTDEALRVRRSGASAWITYKGPKLDAVTKSRMEIEVPLADGREARAACEMLFEKLGFRRVAVVRKQRRIYQTRRGGFGLEICLDDVDQVGKFVELEIQADEAHFEAAKSALLAIANELGLGESERRSYLNLLLLNSRA
jgi:adenylate cyclase class 2